MDENDLKKAFEDSVKQTCDIMVNALKTMGFEKYQFGDNSVPRPNMVEEFDFYMRNDTGSYGEYLAKYMLEHLKEGYYKVLANVYVPYKNGTTEIDILLVHEKGIFVIESKNYSGWIFGSAEDTYWTQMLNKYTKNRFYNPIKQNQTHINLLSQYLEIDKRKFMSYIVFSQRCELKKVPYNTDSFIILKRDDLYGSIRQKIKSGKNIFTHEEIDLIEQKLISLTNVSDEVKEKHIDDINEKYS